MRRILLILIFSLGNVSCSKKIVYTDYLSPMDRTSEGFLDKSTYQVLGFGHAFNLSELEQFKPVYFPETLQEGFDTISLVNYNIELKNQKGSIDWKRMADPQLNLLVTGIAPEQLTPEVLSALAMREKSGQIACKAAIYNALEVWTHASDTVKMVKSNERFPLEKAPYYVKSMDEKIQLIEKQIQDTGVRVEFIEETVVDYDKLECHAVIHFKKENLLQDREYLRAD